MCDTKRADFSHLFQPYNLARLCLDSRVGLFWTGCLACECDRIGGAGLCLQSTWKEPAAAAANPMAAVNIQEMMRVWLCDSWPQYATDELSRCVSTPPTPTSLSLHSFTLFLSLSHFHHIPFDSFFFFFPLAPTFCFQRFNIHLLSSYICPLLAVANRTHTHTQKWWCKAPCDKEKYFSGYFSTFSSY